MSTRVAEAPTPEYARSTAGSTELYSMADSAQTLARSIAAYSKARPCSRYNIRLRIRYNRRRADRNPQGYLLPARGTRGT